VRKEEELQKLRSLLGDKRISNKYIG